MRKRESGAVMIAALIISALVVTLSIGLSVAHNRSLLHAESRFHGNQAREYIFGGEDLARFVLNEDAESDQNDNEIVDSLDEGWSQQQQFPLDEGGLIGQIIDAQSRLDINRLATHATPPGGENSNNSLDNLSPSDPMRYTADQRRFIRLLQLLDEEEPMSQDEAIAILEAVIDWLDPDSTPFGFDGAEALYYQRFDPPVTPPDGPINSITELRYVKGITPQIYQALAPHIIALPAGEGLNINTASETLIRTLNVDTLLSPLSVLDSEQIMLDLAGGPYLDSGAFLASPTPSSLSNQGNFEIDGMTFSSNYFILSTQVEVGRQRRSLVTLLHRDGGDTRVVRHADFVL